MMRSSGWYQPGQFTCSHLLMFSLAAVILALVDALDVRTEGGDGGRATLTGENIDAVDVGPNGTIYFSTQGAFDIPSGAAHSLARLADIETGTLLP